MVTLEKHIVLVSQAKEKAKEWYHWCGVALDFTPTYYTDKVPTAAVDEVGRMYINPEFICNFNGKPMSPEMVAWVMLHEHFHNFLDHAERRQTYVPHANQQNLEAWNIAADLVIQQMLDQYDRYRPEGTVNYDDCKERWPKVTPNCTVERYYSVILEGMQEEAKTPPPPPPPPRGRPDDDTDIGIPGDDGGNQSDGETGEDDDNQNHSGGKPDDSQSEPTSDIPGSSSADGVQRDYEEERDLGSVGSNLSRLEEVRQSLSEDESIGQGSTAGNVRQMLNNKLVHQPDPFDKLRNVVARSVTAREGNPEETYRKRSRRQTDDDLPIKGNIYYQPECTIVIDTSGSMTSRARTERAMTAIAQGCQRVRNPRVIAWDAELQGDGRIASPANFQWSGCGGTDMTGALLYAAKEHKPDCIVLVTDGGTRWPDKPLNCPLIVALVANDGYPPPWAQTVDLTKGGKINVC